MSDVQREYAALLKDYVGRPSPLYHAERLSEHYKRWVHAVLYVSACARQCTCVTWQYL